MATIGASAFRRDCCKLLANLPPEGLTITLRGRPIAIATSKLPPKPKSKSKPPSPRARRPKSR